MLRIINSAVRRSIFIIVLVIIVAAAGAGAWLNTRSTDSAIRDQLKNRSASIAELLDKEDIKSLTGSPSDLDSTAYKDTKKTLAKLKEHNPDIRTIYITMERDDKLYFYVDSESPTSDFYSPPGEYYPDATPAFKEVFRNGEAAVEGPTKDDFGTWVSGLAPIRDSENGAILGVLGTDIEASYYYRAVIQAAAIPLLLGALALAFAITTEVIRMRQERQLRLQSELVSIASHELRSPLSGVRWATESLIPHLDNDNKIMAQRILVSATKLQASIDDILQISRLTRPGSSNKLVLADYDLTKLVHDVCEGQQLTAEQRGVKITMDGSWNTMITIHCDSERIKRALQNVVSNAVKYTRENTEIYINYHHNGDAHQIRVTDQGIGIPDGEKSKIFQGFYRASNARDSKIKGTGLGLFLTRTIIEQHGGKVTVDSRQDVGTTITLTIPG